MCLLIVFYSVDGNESLSDADVISYDPRTADCFPQYTQSDFGFGSNADALSSYSAPALIWNFF